MSWQFHNRAPVFLQIADRVRAEILEGKYPPDSQIPSVRQLAFEAAVNPNTMQRALTQLEEEGLLSSRGTLGRFVTSDRGVLETARKSMHEEAMRTLLHEALALGITKSDLIDFIQKEETI